MKYLLEKGKPRVKIGFFDALEHAICGCHQKVTLTLLQNNATKKEVPRLWRFLLAQPIHYIDRINGHLINPGNEYEEIENLMKKPDLNARPQDYSLFFPIYAFGIFVMIFFAFYVLYKVMALIVMP